MSYADDVAKQMASVQPMPEDSMTNLLDAIDSIDALRGGIPEGKVNLVMACSGTGKAMVLGATDEDDG